MIAKIQSLDISSLPISEYSKRYLQRILTSFPYYEAIYNHCLDRMFTGLEKPLEQITLVDYGGGHGLLSVMAKERGVGQVIYVDFNPQAVETVEALTDRLGYGPDVVLTGDALMLRQWCEREGEVPDIVMGMDVIEHIYCLDDFFAELYAMAPKVKMLFTTASNPYNKRLCRRLRKVMERDEARFSAQRRAFIAQHYPDYGATMLDLWTRQTRGLNYDDILRAVDTQSPNLLRDPYNTCDPETGSWTERILPISDYRQLLQPYGAELEVSNGFYNVWRNGVKAFLSQLMNLRIRLPRGRRKSPFIILTIQTR